MLCFDEVMTGFRIAKGCAQEYFGVTPDLTTMGKVRVGRMQGADVPLKSHHAVWSVWGKGSLS